MSPPTKQRQSSVRSSEQPPQQASQQVDLLANEVSTTERVDEQSATPWLFLQQGYDWTGGSLRTKGYRTDFDSIHERETVVRTPAMTPGQQDSAAMARNLDWRHPGHLDAVAEFVSSLAPATAPSMRASAPALRTIEAAPRFWYLLGVGVAIACLLALVSFYLGYLGNSSTQPQPPQRQPREVAAVSQPSVAVPAASAETSLPVTAAPAPVSVPVPSHAEEVVVSSGGAKSSAPPAASSPIELEAREILVSGRAVAAVVLLKRTGSNLGPVRVRWKTVPGTAMPAKDYESVSGIARFAEDQTVRTLFVPILQPPSRNEPRTFSIELQRLRNGPALGPIKSTTVTIWGDT